MSPRRALTIAVLAGMAAAGLGLYAATRVWTTVSRDRPGPLPAEVVDTTGGQLAPWAIPAAVVAVAGSVALVACTGWARRIVAVCVGLAGLGLTAAGGYGLSQAAGIWPVVTTVAGLAVLAVAAWTLRDGSAWPGMSGRYDRTEAAPSSAALADDPAALWDALDKGEDPTAFSIGQTAPGEECAR
ncbi:Trp biosynthesis-associated membrane protein [Stackebrandtia nassauensis]|uniref:Trp biosynthesis associated, transmembrane protein, Oprn/Chp n=1 Tax=Stackebrandtia nassauensis (strain DSM 44728 / CIP 108903 / NRRL B-16338 / NBRC 102104 / LLR-40K-21) TaxID=446470 RepID=D3Q510_STANL|nr:Trp biosynthesis-associated membrane protein [Stackebrandtia nassauensis]ADD42190.1 hypothetical protein Snas_2508 [Stackebrandtia nassauensis DSM 44728]